MDVDRAALVIRTGVGRVITAGPAAGAYAAPSAQPPVGAGNVSTVMPIKPGAIVLPEGGDGLHPAGFVQRSSGNP